MEWGSRLSVRSSHAAIVLALALGGCDLAFGFDTGEKPCDVTTFDSARHTDLAVAEDFSVDWDQTFAVIIQEGASFELPLPTGTPVPIDLGIYPSGALSLTPEGNALFYTADIEPPLLQGALRKTEGSWQIAATVPRGTFAGTPSADVFGPRHLLVQLRTGDGAIQEYVDADGHWVTVGDPHPLVTESPPNLTPNGLTAVFAKVADDQVTREIYEMSRATTAAWFGEPVKIFAGTAGHPQLLGQCRQLYTLDEGQVRRYDQ